MDDKLLYIVHYLTYPSSYMASYLDMAWPARPQDTYGLEKLYAEEMCLAYAKDFPIKTRIARYHNVYGPRGTWKGGREKVCKYCVVCDRWMDGLIDRCIESRIIWFQLDIYLMRSNIHYFHSSTHSVHCPLTVCVTNASPIHQPINVLKPPTTYTRCLLPSVAKHWCQRRSSRCGAMASRPALSCSSMTA